MLLDTLVVRSLLVPALVRDAGDRVWWPTRPAAGEPDGRSPAPGRRPRTLLPGEDRA
ncbi:hypothetical protein ACL07V_33575 [Streptomyces sp. MB22_4]|uniref:hypothetical protein n=1 Tax=Streptomyces sp. MB22_4 TaxID=3383120 RepID=UPI00399EFAFF